MLRKDAWENWEMEMEMGTGKLFEKFEEKQNIRPDFAETLTKMGIALLNKGKNDEALGALKQALKIKPDYPEALTKMGIALINKGKHDEAIEALEKAIEFIPDYAEARNKKGIALEILRREKESEVDKGITMVEKEGDAGVFISYIHENKVKAHRLCEDLKKSGIKVWIDRDKIKPGHFWPDVIRDAIKKGSFFIACFSKEFKERIRSHMHEELTLAIEELRKRPKDRAWFIPVLFSGEVPNLTISDGVTIRHIQWVDLSQGWDKGINEILSVVSPKEDDKME